MKDRINVLQAVYRAGSGERNEDAYLVAENYAALLDCAVCSFGETDGGKALFAPEFLNAFRKAADDGKPLKDCLNDSLASIKDSCMKRGTGGSSPRGSAAGVFVVLREGFAEFFSAAGSKAIVYKKDGTAELIGRKGPPEAEAKAVCLMMSLAKENGITPAKARVETAVKDILAEIERTADAGGNPEMISEKMRSVTDEDILKIPSESIACVIMFTDGFDMALDSMKSESCTDLESLYDRIRKELDADRDRSRYPRLKHIDDATAIAMEIEKR